MNLHVSHQYTVHAVQTEHQYNIDAYYGAALSSSTPSNNAVSTLCPRPSPRSFLLRVDLLLSLDRVPSSVISRWLRSSDSPTAKAASPTAAAIEQQGSNTIPQGKKKIQLKKKFPSVPVSPPIAGLVPSSIVPGVTTAGKAGAVKKKLVVQPKSGEQLKKTVGVGVKKLDPGKAVSGVAKTNANHRAILKRPGTLKSAVPAGKDVSAFLKTKPAVLLAAKQVGGLPKQGGSPVAGKTGNVKDAKREEGSRKTTGTTSAPICPPADGKAASTQLTEKAEKSPITAQFEFPLQAVCRIGSLHALVAVAECLPVNVSHFLKGLTACINRCEM